VVERTGFGKGEFSIYASATDMHCREQDGGAHVDASLTPEYAALLAGFYFGTDSEGKSDAPFTETHVFALRQIGYELLHNPELLALAT
jgi:hypothetical protein